MSDLPDSSAPGQQYVVDDKEMLVASTHTRIVRRALSDQLGVSSTLIDDDVDLGLAKLQLDAPDGEYDSIWRRLYEYFEGAFDKWHPTIGKNRIVTPVITTGELSWGGEGDPRRLDAPPAGWPPSRGGNGRGVRVAVLDTSAVAGGPLSDGWLDRYSDLRALPAGDQQPFSGHATFIAGLILAQAPAAGIEVRGVLDPETGTASAWQVAKAIVAAGRSGVDIINLSLVCYTKDGKPPMALEHAVARLDPEVVVVAAAGNHGNHPTKSLQRRPAWPAALPSVIAVGAADRNGVEAAFTPHDMPWIDVLTDGVELQSSYITGTLRPEQQGGAGTSFDGWAEWRGTSFAAAVFSGAVAAATRPGRISAQTALRTLLDAADTEGSPPPFLPLVPR